MERKPFTGSPVRPGPSQRDTPCDGHAARPDRAGRAGRADPADPADPADRPNGTVGADDLDKTDDDKTDDLARRALASAQGIGTRRRRRSSRGRQARLDEERANSGYSGARPDPRDPQLLGALLPRYVDDLGWQQPLTEARVFAEWPQLVGAELAAHCAPASLRDGELRITAESTAWATQLRLLASALLARLVAELGPQIVTKLIITGPVAPSWRHGPLSVRGSRGPRDTYG